MDEAVINYMFKSDDPKDTLVTIYTKANCSWCDKAIMLAIDKGYIVETFDVRVEENLKFLKDQLPDVRTVPQIWINDRYVGGYSEFSEEVMEK